MDQYVLSLSYGKDSIACIEAVKQLGYPLDRIVHAEVWATNTIPADLPPMVEFKAYADRIIKERYGIEVEHVCAMNKDGTKKTYEQLFYHIPVRRTKKVTHPSEVSGGGELQRTPNRIPMPTASLVQQQTQSTYSPKHRDSRSEQSDGAGTSKAKTSTNSFRRTDWSGINGFSYTIRPKCQNLKTEAVDGWQRHGGGVRSHLTAQKRDSISDSRSSGDNGVQAISNSGFSDAADRGGVSNTVQYLGIAADEPERIARHIVKPNIRLPLVEIGWDEAFCRKWCEENNLLSPIYTTSARGGCWFCHNQGVEQLRLLRKNYPDLWSLLLKWDSDSPTTFHADGHTVHDFEKRFALEDDGLIQKEKPFKWSMLDDDIHQLSLF